jgi:hypothetical protein
MDDTSSQHNSTEPQLEHHIHSASRALFQSSLHNSDQVQDPFQHQSPTETASSSSTSTWDVVEAHPPSTPHSPERHHRLDNRKNRIGHSRHHPLKLGHLANHSLPRRFSNSLGIHPRHLGRKQDVLGRP